MVAAYVAREVKYEICQKLAGHLLSFIPSLLDNLGKYTIARFQQPGTDPTPPYTRLGGRWQF